MKLLITNDNDKIGIIKDFEDLDDGKKQGLLAQIICELTIVREELLILYETKKEYFEFENGDGK